MAEVTANYGLVHFVCNRPVLFKRMQAKFAPHSPASTPARVDARECGIHFEKVTDMKASTQTSKSIKASNLTEGRKVQLTGFKSIF